jgi:peptidoglycan/xylan/chitin deacetylase (PgdA/CDA1 family)
VRTFKRLLLSALTLPGFTGPLALLARDCSVVFVFHRFGDPERGIRGHEVSVAEKVLAYLRRNKYDLISLPTLLQRLAAGEPLKRTVAFSIDDGYVDMATVAAPLFARYDCPVTGFVVTGFLDGSLWLWWDQIEYILENTKRRHLKVQLGSQTLDYRWENDTERRRLQADYTERCKRVLETEKLHSIRHLAGEAEMDIPTKPPPQYAAMSWNQLRSCEEQGMTFGPHSVTHPILSKLPADQSRYEIAHSWERLRHEARRAVPVFAYPNGHREDFGTREIDTLRSIGLVGALSQIQGYNSPATFGSEHDGAFALRRFGYPETLPHVIQYVTGLEHVKQVIRGEAS